MHPTGPTPSSATTFRSVYCLSILLLLSSPAFTFAAPAQTPRDGFHGRWDITVHDPGGDYPSWMEVHGTRPNLTVTFVGRIGSAEQVRGASINDGVLSFPVPADDAAHPPQHLRATLHGHMLSGEIQQNGQPALSWTGKPAPSLRRPSVSRWGTPQPLFDGQSFSGWHFSSTRHNNWTLADGALQSTGRGGDLISDRSFEDMQLHVEWRCSARANSGVYLRGRYEVQIETDSAAEPATHHTGGVYGFLAPHPEQPREPGTWQSFDIELVGRLITVRQNGILIIDHQLIPGITGGALNSDEASPGPLVLQGGEDGTVEFRNLRVRLPAAAN